MTNAKFRCAVASAVFSLAGIAAAQAREPSRRIEGVVVDALNEPVPVARVWLEDGADRTRIATVTDAQGRFVLAGVRAATQWRLRAEAEGTCVAEARIRASDGGAVLAVHDAASLTGTLATADGRRVPGVPVHVIGAFAVRGLAPLPPVITDAEGRFRCDRVPLGPIHVVAATPSGFAWQHASMPSTQPISLIAKASDRQQLVRITGLLAGDAAKVKLFCCVRAGGGEQLIEWPGGTFDARGECLVSWLPTPNDLALDLLPIADGLSFARRRPFMVRSQTPPLEFDAQREAEALLLTVVDQRQAPVAGLALTVRTSLWPFGRRVVTDAHGRVMGPALAVAEAAACVDVDDALTCIGLAADGHVPCGHRVVPSALPPWRLFADPAAQVRLRAFNPDGAPASHVAAVVDGGCFRQRAIADADGWLSFDSVPVCTVVFRAENRLGQATSEGLTTAPHSTHRFQDLRLERGTNATLRLSDAAGEPAAGVVVFLRRFGYRELVQAVSDRRGVVCFAGLAPGRVTMLGPFAEQDVELEAGVDLDRAIRIKRR